MKNIHILPTNNLSKIGRFIDTKELFLRTFQDIPRGENVEIYIISNEEIRGDIDWMHYKHFGEDIVTKYKTLGGQNTNVNEHKDYYKKIILTTDQDLIKDGVQAINEEFLEWFVKNPSCEEVEVKKLYKNGSGNGDGNLCTHLCT